MKQDQQRSTMDLISDGLNEASALLASEVKLLRAEVNEKINQVIASIVMMATAAIFFLGALFLLLEAGVAYLVEMGCSTTIASLIMFALSAVVGIILFFAGKSGLAADKLKPERSMNQINRDIAMARQVSSGR